MRRATGGRCPRPDAAPACRSALERPHVDCRPGQCLGTNLAWYLDGTLISDPSRRNLSAFHLRSDHHTTHEVRGHSVRMASFVCGHRLERKDAVPAATRQAVSERSLRPLFAFRRVVRRGVLQTRPSAPSWGGACNAGQQRADGENSPRGATGPSSSDNDSWSSSPPPPAIGMRRASLLTSCARQHVRSLPVAP
jgi:hypothetical protein